MNVPCVICELDKLGVQIEEVTLKDGELTVNHLAVSRRPFGIDWPDGKWCVYFISVRERFDISVFDNESAACEKILERILRGIQLRRKYGRMTDRDLETELRQYKIDPTWYSLDGTSYGGDELVLSQIGDGVWVVFKAVRGTKQNEITFSSESEACIHFLDRIVAVAEVLHKHSRSSSGSR